MAELKHFLITITTTIIMISTFLCACVSRVTQVTKHVDKICDNKVRTELNSKSKSIRKL